MEPVGPAGPALPAGPISPFAPAGPAGPTAPARPAGPAKPIAPAGPAGPAGPGSPLGPCTFQVTSCSLGLQAAAPCTSCIVPFPWFTHARSNCAGGLVCACTYVAPPASTATASAPPAAQPSFGS